MNATVRNLLLLWLLPIIRKKTETAGIAGAYEHNLHRFLLNRRYELESVVAVPLTVSGAFGKAAGLVVRPVFTAVGKEVAKRGADSLGGRNPLSLDADLSAAIDVLLNDAETAFGQLKVWLQAAISVPPTVLTDESARTWFARADVQVVLKQAAIAFITIQPLDAYVEGAKRLYGDSSGERNARSATTSKPTTGFREPADIASVRPANRSR